ncbi:MAG: TRAP transporter substrate-binding protein DctP [Pseudomonadota bacterium]
MRPIAVALAASLCLAAPAANAQEVIRAVTSLPAPLEFTKGFLRFVDRVNAAGEGVVRIDVVGGPEVIPPTQQQTAIRRGVIDMQYGPSSYYLGEVPEANAWAGSTISAMEGREKGGFAIMEEVYADRLNAKLLAQVDGGVTFHIYLTKAPAMTDDGAVDLAGLRLRSVPIYREFFAAQGATPVSIPVPEVYTALERGAVDGAGWPLPGIQDLSWDRFLTHRIDPPFFQTDITVMMNLDRWNSLSQAAKDIIAAEAKAYEKISYDDFQRIIAETDKAVREAGMTIITMEGAAAEAYLDSAFNTPWEKLAESDSPHTEALRAIYYTR